MKILSLRLKNINSLYGEWNINFQAPEYKENGIFLLTGPIGSGKTTVLDAISLSLYGQTPRINDISQNKNDVMSQHTADCFAEVTFEVHSVRYIAHWSQYRARKKADGALQVIKRELSRLEPNSQTAILLENKPKKINDLVKEITGLDYSQFTRSFLLAQGEFDKFLKADSKDKSEILENITGTEIYSTISSRVFERNKSEQGKLELFKAECDKIICMSPEDEEKLLQNIQDQEDQKKDFQEQLKKVEEAVLWRKGIIAIESNLKNIEADEEILAKDYRAFQPEKERLQRAIVAANLDGSYANMLALRRQQTEDERTRQEALDSLPNLESQLTQTQNDSNVAKKSWEDAEARYNNTLPLIGEILLLDKDIDTKKGEVGITETLCDALNKKIVDEQSKCDQLNKELQDIQQQLTKIDQFFQENQCDAKLVGGFSGLKSELNHLSDKKKLLDKCKKDVNNLDVTIQNQTQEHQQAEKNLLSLTEQGKHLEEVLKQDQKKLDTLLNGRSIQEYNAEKEALLRDKAFHKVIADLSSARHDLEDGKPCPLCGALAHPYAEGNIPSPSETEQKIKAISQLIEQAELYNESIKKHKEETDQHKDAIHQGQQAESKALQQLQNSRSNHQSAVDLRNTAQTDYDNAMSAIRLALKPLGLEDISLLKIPSLVKSLENRLNTWNSHLTEQAELQNQQNQLNQELSNTEKERDHQIANRIEKQQNLEKHKSELAALEEDRKDKFGDKDPIEEQKRLEREKKEAKENLDKAQKSLDELQAQKTKTETNIHATEDRINKRKPILADQENAFKKDWSNAGFADENDFIAARMDCDTREQLQRTANQLKERSTKLATLKTDRQNSLDAENKKAVTTESLNDLELKKSELELKSKENETALLELNRKHTENQEHKKESAKKQAEYNAQKLVAESWRKLDVLIGSRDGAKYRKYVQGLTFDFVVHHANLQLREMTDRYLLVPAKDEPLGLNVKDLYLADTERTTHNLSGGERFLVSLALAIGLSHTAGRNIQMDSLFMDEGFGTLDEDTLTMVTNTLCKIQEGGKLIGIISHVQELREIIKTQIVVTPGSGGKSRLSGPGIKAGH